MENIFNWKPIYASSYKQEALEEFKKRFANDESNKNIKLNYQDGIYYGIEVGAKWQQERSYSEEDLKEAFIEGYKQRAEKSDLIFDNASIMYAIHLFKKFKNK